MILRRLTTAFRKQDWFTVLIETLIVVLGVFLGIQLGNWNEARANRAGLTRALERLEAEAAQNIQIADDILQLTEEAQADRELTKKAVSNCEETPEAVAALGRALLDFTDDIQPHFVFVTLEQVSSHDAYQDLMSPAFSEAIAAYNARLNEEQNQIANHYDKLWDYSVVKHPSVTAYFVGPESDWSYSIAVPFTEVCADPTFRSRFINTIGFIESIESRLKRLKSQIADFQTAIGDELENRR